MVESAATVQGRLSADEETLTKMVVVCILQFLEGVVVVVLGGTAVAVVAPWLS